MDATRRRTTSDDAASPDAAPYEAGFRSTDREVAQIELPVTGRLPDWLSGALLRVAPAQFEVGAQSYAHWFDGLARLHRFGVVDGRVRYASRFLRSEAFGEAKRQGRIVHAEFATDPCRSLFGRVQAILEPTITDNAVVSVNRIGGDMVALTETRLPVRFDPQTLETLGVHDWGSSVDGSVSTAHPHHDGERAYTYLISFGRRSAYHVHAVDEAGTEREIARIPVDRPSYMHSFGMSARRIVLAEFPFVVNPLRLYLSNEPFIRNYRWDPTRGTTFTVLDKETGALVGRWSAPPLFAFHHVNAVETEAGLEVDLVAYDDASVIDDLYLARLRGSTPVRAVGRLTRLTLPPGGGPVAMRTLSHTPIELPRIDYPNRQGRAYRYVWGNGQAGGDFLDSIVKLDLAGDPAANARVWREDGAWPGEPVLVRRPGSEAEDDGVLLSVVLDARAERSFLLVLDAATLEEVARAQAPEIVTFGFHGNFIGDPDAGPLHA
ncbi:carotenoid oxygenase family protein [Salinarimonas ramus]|uniref:Dioxygenase n=1 Tax=Salinarimonas ramus TaxID=690164 RepID=A0A917QK98_9HYPH|nr:carotenoid oxygenase family protein [Salinarimonas ramus]GGK54435.1 15,15' beta carotene dioxygenase [Salinarimonas ramus]